MQDMQENQPSVLMSRHVARELNFDEMNAVSGGVFEGNNTTQFTDCHASYTLDCAGVDGGD